MDDSRRASYGDEAIASSRSASRSSPTAVLSAAESSRSLQTPMYCPGTCDDSTLTTEHRLLPGRTWAFARW